MSARNALPQCFVEVYPFEGGPYVLTGAQVTSTQVTKTLDANGGAFSLVLAPGGPGGVNSMVEWAEVITPMSFCVIGMRRDVYSNILMLGVVTSVRTGQQWSGGKVQRVTYVTGIDMSYFFTTFSYFTLSFMGLTAGTLLGNELGLGPAQFPQQLADPFFNGTPPEIATVWYNRVMAGPRTVMSNTYVPYQNNARIKLYDMLGVAFEEYPGAYLQYTSSLLTLDGSWMDKFRAVMPYPWYELFVTTAPGDFYGRRGNPQGREFTMKSLPDAQPVVPQLVGRVNPLPVIGVNGAGTSATPTLGNLDVTKWNALPLYKPMDFNFTDSGLVFGVDEVRNFYILNPTGFRNLYQSDGGTDLFMWQYMGAANPASIHRYGYRPYSASTEWLYDPRGTNAQNSTFNMAQTVSTLVARMFSIHEPAPLMGRAVVTMPLRPDIMPGCRFAYRPLKMSEPWVFYIKGVEHSFQFGKQTSTSLTLARGLPASVYEDASENGVLRALHIGNAQRLNGKYQVGLPKGAVAPLQLFGGDESAARTVMGQIAQVFQTPQAN